MIFLQNTPPNERYQPPCRAPEATLVPRLRTTAREKSRAADRLFCSLADGSAGTLQSFTWESTMPFDVKINFSGLCLFAPEPGGTVGPDRMHVLMPKVAHHTHGPDRHIPVVYFDVAHLSPTPMPLKNIFAQVLLRGHTMELGSGGATLALCSQMANLKEVTGRDAKPNLFGSDPDKRLDSRVTLSGGSMTAASEGYCWEWDPGVVRRISHQVEWTIPGLTTLPLQLEAIDAETTNARTLPPLYPVAGDAGDVIYLYIHHVPSAELPPDQDKGHELMPGQETPHFSAYYSLFGGPVPTRVPRYWSKMSDAQPTSTPCPVLSGWRGPRGEGAYNCMVAGAW
jgi:hypothetical protein